MKNKNTKSNSSSNSKSHAKRKSPKAARSKQVSSQPIRVDSGRQYRNPVDYDHPYDSMGQFAKLLALKYDANRTRYAYYRAMRLIHERFGCDPISLCEEQLRDYFLFVKLEKEWKPKSMRQAIASAKLFFAHMLERENWKVFSQIRTKDHDELATVLTREQVHQLLSSIRLRRYRTPAKLIYSCGLRLSECLSLTIHDIVGKENKLFIKGSKGHKDRMVPLATPMVEDLRCYWAFHKNPLLIFPGAGRGVQKDPVKLAARMHESTRPMPHSSLQRLMRVAQEKLGLVDATPHTLRHSFATHLIESGASLHTMQSLLGHAHIETTMRYIHLTHQTETDTMLLMEELCDGLPR